MTDAESATEFSFGTCRVSRDTRQLIVDGAPARLGTRAFELLLALIERRDRVVSKNELLDVVWPDLVVEENNLQVHMCTLRKLLGSETISTIPGRGYRFTAALASEVPVTERIAFLPPLTGVAPGPNPVVCSVAKQT